MKSNADKGVQNGTEFKKHRFSSPKVNIFVPSMHKTCIIRNLGALGCRSRQVYQLLFQTHQASKRLFTDIFPK